MKHKRSNWRTSDLHLGKLTSKRTFFYQNDTTFLANPEPMLGWESVNVCHNLRTEKEGTCEK